MLGTDDKGDDDGGNAETLTEYSATVERISSAVLDGNSIYYLQINGEVFTADITVWNYLPLLREGDTVTFLANSKHEIRSFSDTEESAS